MIASIEKTWCQDLTSNHLNLTEDGTCVSAKSRKCGITFSDFIIPANSGIWTGIFEVQNPRSSDTNVKGEKDWICWCRTCLQSCLAQIQT